MNIAIINNGQVVNVGDYRALFPQTSFPASGPGDEFLENNNAVRVTAWLPHDAQTSKLQSCAPYIQDGIVYTVEVVAITADDIAARNQSLAAEVRKRRNDLLASSDWTQTLDSPVDQRSEWQTYRQELRDIPQQTGFPTNVIWPSEPV